MMMDNKQIELLTITKRGTKTPFYIDCLQKGKATVLVLWKPLIINKVHKKRTLLVMSINNHGYIIGKKEKTYNTSKNAVSASVKEFLKATKISIKRTIKTELSLKQKKELKSILQKQLSRWVH